MTRVVTNWTEEKEYLQDEIDYYKERLATSTEFNERYQERLSHYQSALEIAIAKEKSGGDNWELTSDCGGYYSVIGYVNYAYKTSARSWVSGDNSSSNVCT